MAYRHSMYHPDDTQKNTYTPYSIRHNITDKDLAGLLDYLERIMGWDIEQYQSFSDNTDWWWCIKTDFCAITFYDGDIYFHVYKNNVRWFSDMPQELFFRTYKTLLPALRDLYSK